MISEIWKLQISAYIDNEQTAQERQDTEALLATNHECQAYYHELRQLRLTLNAVPNQSLSLDAHMAISQRLAKEKPMKPSMLKIGTAVIAVMVMMAVSYQLVLKDMHHMKASQLGRQNADDIGEQFSKGTVDLTKEKVVVVPQTIVSEQVDQQASYVLEEKVAGGDAVALQAKGTQNATYRARESYVPAAARSAEGEWSGGLMALSLSQANIVNDSSVIEVVMRAPSRVTVGEFNTEEYSLIQENNFLTALDNPLSTFSIDVDTASYSNIRRYLMSNQMPPKDAVRIEEMVNYFTYDYKPPTDDKPFSVTTDLAVCPWSKDHQLLRIGLKGKVPAQPNDLPPSNLVFLIDVSGSMDEPAKLPLLQQGLNMMVNHLRDKDTVALVTYAGNAGVVLEPTSGRDKETIKNAINRLNAGGSTAGGEGIRLAYEIAKKHFIKGGNNRVVLATDGDFNVGVSSTSEMTRLIEEKRGDGIFLTVLGFGQGNLKDSRMESLADHGNGNYYYIDTQNEARKVLVDELGSTIFTIAKDVKIQIEFNPLAVASYRLLGYENRALAKEDFNNDAKDAGEIGAGHTVTALYEIIPAGLKGAVNSTDPLKYQQVKPVTSDDVLTVKLRYKDPDSNTSQLISEVVKKTDVTSEPSGDFAWAAAVAEFGMLLRNSEFRAQASYDHVLKSARLSLGNDAQGLRKEFVTMVEKAQALAPTQGTGEMQFKK